MMNVEMSKLIALKLASLHKSDLDWIFSQLDGDVKDRLRSLVNEIHDVGLDLEQARSVIDNYNLFNEDNSEDELFSKLIDTAEYKEILQIFNGEHPFFIEKLTSLYDWSWRNSSNKKMENSKKTLHAKSTEQRSLLARAILDVTEKRLLERSAIDNVAKHKSATQSFMLYVLRNIPILRKFA
jgi:regulator of replication initiation timing